MKKMKKFAGVALAGIIGLSGLLFLEPNVSAAKIPELEDENFNAITVSLKQNEKYILSGRSIDILSGDVEAVMLNKYTIQFEKPGQYIVRVNGCIYNDVYTFLVEE
ncbi:MULTISPECIES: hypothetical protein [unclassified Bacillus cereus group]|uniref:hypothetical protein n=1 Tax=unclassified Bacillus cereus group TaxID=2750818 RepID=UPI001F5A55BD|nr:MULTISPECIES: hypothetical protein [unclassified Bacillus cereus group]